MSRLEKLRSIMRQHDCDAYLITDSDNHYTFYSLLHEYRRINWITQCQAQCGLALVTQRLGAAFQVPPNYWLLAENEVNQKDWSIVNDIVAWIANTCPYVIRIGYDSQLMPLFINQLFTKSFYSNRYELYPIRYGINLIDAISNGETRPIGHLQTPLFDMDLFSYVGESTSSKLERLRMTYLNTQFEKYTFITGSMDEIAWLLNLRANDMPCNPLFFSYMIVSNDDLIIFTDNSNRIRKFKVLPYEQFFSFLSTIKSTNVWVDERISMKAIESLVEYPKKVARSPIQQMKEIKNKVELHGFQECHYRDCQAVCQTFQWLQECIDKNSFVTERLVAQYLEARQREQDHFVSIAFDTISAVRENTALIEYVPAIEGEQKTIGPDLYYLDAGANYLDGTTDMTRTLHFGQPSKKQIECYTLVLRGILAVEMTCFPSQNFISGYRIDALLQQHLNSYRYKSQGVSFGHGVSHGHGVIEGGVIISDHSPASNKISIRPGMILTLEPGVYFNQEWGIRLENVYKIEEIEHGWMQFIPLTLIPYSCKMIDFNLLSREEINWLLRYHRRCQEKINGGAWMMNEINQFLKQQNE